MHFMCYTTEVPISALGYVTYTMYAVLPFYSKKQTWAAQFLTCSTMAISRQL